MTVGVDITLYKGSVTNNNLTNIQALWWDVTEPKDAEEPIGKTVVATTNSTGHLLLDLSECTSLSIGGYGFLMLYKLDGGNHENSPIFCGKVQTSDVTDGVVLMSKLTHWKRNPSWLALPEVLATDQICVGLHKVEKSANFVAFSATSNYHVDWGDGTSENVNSGVTASHEFSYSDSDLDGSDGPVTFTDTGDLVNRTGHNYANGDDLKFYDIVATTGVTEGQTYYVVNATTDNFQVAATKGGTPLTLTTNGSAKLLPYKQAIITITPQGGNNLVTLNLQLKHSQSGLQMYASGFIDLSIAGNNLNTLFLGTVEPGSGSRNVRFNNLEQVNIVSSDLIQCNSLFYDCPKLASIINLSLSPVSASSSAVTFQSSGSTVTHTAHGKRNGDPVVFSSIVTTTGITINTLYFVRNVTTNTYQVSSSYSGSAITLTNNGTGTAHYGASLYHLFWGCKSLTALPKFDTSSVIWFVRMFSGCSGLESIPRFNTAAGLSFSNMFLTCSALKAIPLIDTSSCRDFSSMFSSCPILETIPLLDTSAGTNFSNMFLGCFSLKAIPLLDTSAGTNFNQMFGSCSTLETIPLLDTSSGTDFSSMFNSCSTLETIPLLDTSAGTNFSNMFNSAVSLTVVPPLNVSQATAFTNMFNACGSLSAAVLTGCDETISYTGCKLSASALNDIYTSLATVVSKTITVTNNYGNASDDPSIATAKGWTVTG